MGIVIDPTQQHTVDVEGATFSVVSLTGRQVLGLSQTLSNVETNADGVYQVLHKCVKSWDGVTTGEGAALPCSGENLDALPVDVAVKVFEFIASLSGLSGGDQGN